MMWTVTRASWLLLKTIPLPYVVATRSSEAASPGARIIGADVVCDEKVSLQTLSELQVSCLYSICLKRMVRMVFPIPVAVMRRIR
jgi:hypothetical protein